MRVDDRTSQAELKVTADRLRDRLGGLPLPEGALDFDDAPAMVQARNVVETELGRVVSLQRPPGAYLAPMIGGAVQPWPPGAQILHIYAIPEITADLAEVLAVHRGVDAALIAPVQDPWLHMTIARIDTLAPGDARVDALADALHQCVPRSLTYSLPPSAPASRDIEATAQLARNGTLLGIPDDDRVADRLLRAARTASGRIGMDGYGDDLRQPAHPHISTGYCASAVAGLDPAAVAELSDMIGAHHLHVPIAAVELAWVRQDPTIPTYTWRTHTRVDLS